MAALLPVAMNLYFVAHRMVFLGGSRSDDANSDGGERDGKQNFLHGVFLGQIDLVGERPAILAPVVER